RGGSVRQPPPPRGLWPCRVGPPARSGRPGSIPPPPAVLPRDAGGTGAWDPAGAARRHAKRRAATDLAALYRAGDAVYAPYSCPATAECCQLAARGREPWLWEVEWNALRSALPSLPPRRADGGCPFLDAAGRRCTAYAHRPLGCRTYFCHRVGGPGHEPVAEMDRLQRRLLSVARTLNPDEEGPRPLTAWYGEVSR